MGRQINPLTLGKPGFCNVCGKPAGDMHIANSRPCYFCHKGVFVHRKYWDQALCSCERAPDCPWCGGCGIIAIPKEDPALDWELADTGSQMECPLMPPGYPADVSGADP